MVMSRKSLTKAKSPHHSLARKSVHLKRSLCAPAKTSNVKVIIRVRPESTKEISSNFRKVVEVVDDKMLIFDPKVEEESFFFHGVKQNSRNPLKRQQKDATYIFDKVFGPNSKNIDIFEGSTKELIQSLLDGYNCSVFVYGATGAGKTHTMLGNSENPGITYLTMAELYKQIQLLKDERKIDIKVSYLEIYNENVRDLLKPSSPLHLRDDGKSGICVSGLKYEEIDNVEKLLTLLDQGNKNRTQHPTDANAESSRSHAVFQVHVRMAHKISNQMNMVKLSMIDLAGSERASATGCAGMRFTEGANINRSLLALGNCINSLADGLKHVPYRDSKLTRLLKDSIGGNCRTVMIANISPSSKSYEDTQNTLKYASRAMKIKSEVKTNVVNLDKHITQYVKLVEELNARVAAQNLEITTLKDQLKSMECEKKPDADDPVTPQLIQSEEFVRWKEKLNILFNTKRQIHNDILKIQMNRKLLIWRIAMKKKITQHLASICFDVDELTEARNRIQATIKQFEGRERGLERALHISQTNRQIVDKELEYALNLVKKSDFAEMLKPEIIINTLMVEKEEALLKEKHQRKLVTMQENELEAYNNIIIKVCSLTKDNYLILRGYGKTTDSMTEKFQNIVKMIGGVKGISWQDQNAIESEIINILRISSPFHKYANSSEDSSESSSNSNNDIQNDNTNLLSEESSNTSSEGNDKTEHLDLNLSGSPDCLGPNNTTFCTDIPKFGSECNLNKTYVQLDTEERNIPLMVKDGIDSTTVKMKIRKTSLKTSSPKLMIRKGPSLKRHANLSNGTKQSTFKDVGVMKRAIEMAPSSLNKENKNPHKNVFTNTKPALTQNNKLLSARSRPLLPRNILPNRQAVKDIQVLAPIKQNSNSPLEVQDKLNFNKTVLKCGK